MLLDDDQQHVFTLSYAFVVLTRQECTHQHEERAAEQQDHELVDPAHQLRPPGAVLARVHAPQVAEHVLVGPVRARVARAHPRARQRRPAAARATAPRAARFHQICWWWWTAAFSCPRSP